MHSPALIGIVAAMFLASVFSTADTLLLAAANSVVADIWAVRKGLRLTAGRMDDQGDLTLTGCRLALLAVGVGTVVVTLLSAVPGLGLADIILAVFAGQAILGVLVLVALWRPQQALHRGRGAVWAAVVGLAAPVAVVGVASALRDPLLAQAAPVLSVILATALLFLVRGGGAPRGAGEEGGGEA